VAAAGEENEWRQKKRGAKYQLSAKIKIRKYGYGTGGGAKISGAVAAKRENKARAKHQAPEKHKRAGGKRARAKTAAYWRGSLAMAA